MSDTVEARPMTSGGDRRRKGIFVAAMALLIAVIGVVAVAVAIQTVNVVDSHTQNQTAQGNLIGIFDQPFAGTDKAGEFGLPVSDGRSLRDPEEFWTHDPKFRGGVLIGGGLVPFEWEPTHALDPLGRSGDFLKQDSIPGTTPITNGSGTIDDGFLIPGNTFQVGNGWVRSPLFTFPFPNQIPLTPTAPGDVFISSPDAPYPFGSPPAPPSAADANRCYCPDFWTVGGSPTPRWESNPCYEAFPLDIGTLQVGGTSAPPADMASQWAFKKLGLPVAIPRDQLSPVTVAVIDSGLDYRHPLLKRGNVWLNPEPDSDPAYPHDFIGWNFVRSSNNPWDDFGHGTFVAGLIAAVNPAARIMPLKVLDRFGGTWGSTMTRAIIYAVDHGARVINISAGGVGVSGLQQSVVEYARRQGVVIVVAAGNTGVDTATIGPAALRGVITVAPTDQNDKKPAFGNWGQQVALAAPGVDIVSLRARRTDFVLIATRGKNYKPGDNIIGADRMHIRANGTSFSAPFVSGAAALLLSRDPNLTSAQVERMLIESADDIETPGWDQFTGAGRLNIARALQANPNYYLTAKISAITPIREGGQTVVGVSGTALGSHLDRYEVQLGQGESPSQWKTVATERGREVDGDFLARIPTKEITARGKWIVRLLVRDTGGKTKEARGSLNVQ